MTTGVGGIPARLTSTESARHHGMTPDRRPRYRYVFRLSTLLAVASFAVLTSPGLAVHGGRIPIVLFIYVLFLLAFACERAIDRRGIGAEVGWRRAELCCLVAWIVVLMWNMLFRDLPASLFGWSVVAFLFYLMAVLHVTQEDATYEFLVQAIFVVTAINAAIALPALASHPGIARIVASPGADPDLAGMRSGGFDHYSAYAICFPAFLSTALSKRGKQRALFLLMCVPIAVAVGTSMYTTALLVLVLGTILVILLRVYVTQRGRHNAGMGAALLVACLLVFAIQGARQWPPFEYAVNRLSQEYASEYRRLGMAELGDGRGGLTIMSLGTFLEHPLFGIGPAFGGSSKLWTLVGGHGAWADSLAEYGLLGFLPYLLFVYVSSRRILQSLRWSGFSVPDQGRTVSLLMFITFGFLNPLVHSLLTLTMFYILVLGGRNVHPARALQQRRAY